MNSNNANLNHGVLAKPIRILIIGCEADIIYNELMKPHLALAERHPFYEHLSLEGERPQKADEILSSGLSRLLALTSTPDALFDWVNNVSYRFEPMTHLGLTSKGLVRLNPRGLTEWTVVHELAHAWDASEGWHLSAALREYTHSRAAWSLLRKWFPDSPLFWYRVGSPPPPCGAGRNFNAREDFAESITAFIFPNLASHKAAKRGLPYEKFGYSHFHYTPRGIFIHELIVQKTTPS